MDLAERERGGTDWIYVAQDRDKWRAVVDNVIEPSGTIKCW
jgi:hypothetical protein